MNAAPWLNTAWMLSCAGEARALRRAMRYVRPTQESVLRRILRENRDTVFGRQYRFAEINSTDQYQQRVPMAQHDRFAPLIDRIARGEPGVLTREPVLLLEPTGGSTGAEKLIPYTHSLRREFQRGLAAWIHDLLHQLPASRQGRSYWSISPMVQESRVSSGGIPIGFEDDRDYLGAWQRWAVSRLLVVPPQLRRLRSPENARYVTLLYLLACPDLAVISVWSPTFLTALLADVPQSWEAVHADLRIGRVRLPRPTLESSAVRLPLPRSPRRADQLRRILGSTAEMPDQLAACWPRLSLLSCWADAASAMYVPPLQSLFPQVLLQPKGLLATEGVISLPLIGFPGSALALRSHFLEFIDVQAARDHRLNEMCLADELEIGRRYRVVLTTGGGLYRYELGDEIEVVGFCQACPLVRFVGRGGAISDLVGEKLNEQHVCAAIDSACQQSGVTPHFALLVPTRESPARYRLYLHCLPGHGTLLEQQLAQRLETLLRENPQYRVAILSGQLRPADVQLVQRDAWSIYQQVCVDRGQRIGDIKPTTLDSWTGWEGVFGGRRGDADRGSPGRAG